MIIQVDVSALTHWYESVLPAPSASGIDFDIFEIPRHISEQECVIKLSKEGFETSRSGNAFRRDLRDLQNSKLDWIAPFVCIPWKDSKTAVVMPKIKIFSSLNELSEIKNKVCMELMDAGFIVDDVIQLGRFGNRWVLTDLSSLRRV